MPKRRVKGEVVSNKTDKTVVVSVASTTKHPMYHKVVSHTTKYKAHDPENECGVGDTIIIEESRPISKHKKWVLKEIVAKAA